MPRRTFESATPSPDLERPWSKKLTPTPEPAEPLLPPSTSSAAHSPSAAGIVILVLLLLLAIGGFAWSYWRYSQARQKILYLTTPQGQQELAKQEAEKVLEQVKRHIILPEGEEPLVATIQDASSLKAQQAFYANAENGDKLIVFKDKAIIYSPLRDVLVNVGPVYFQQNDQKESQPSRAVTPPPPTPAPSPEPTPPSEGESER